MFRRLLERYSDATQKWPYRTNIGMAGFLWFSGDIISQLLEGKRFFVSNTKNKDGLHSLPEPIDWRRVLQMMGYGFFVAGPIYTWWYRLLDRKTLPLKAGILYFLNSKPLLMKLF